MFLRIVIRRVYSCQNYSQTVNMSNLNLKGTTLFYTTYISHATICKLFVNKLGGMTYISLFQMQSLANSINFSHAGKIRENRYLLIGN
jgi:hypothetical protein